MKKEDVKDVIKDLNAYHEEKERKYFERNLLKQKIGKIIFILVLIMVVMLYILYLILAPKETIETFETTVNFLRNLNYSV